jgi:hypothetical protein
MLTYDLGMWCFCKGFGCPAGNFVVQLGILWFSWAFCESAGNFVVQLGIFWLSWEYTVVAQLGMLGFSSGML